MQILIASTGATFAAEPAFDLVTSAVRAGCSVGHSCRQGICGTCKAIITSGSYSIQGSTDIQSVGLEDPPQEVLLCQISPRSDIVMLHEPPSADKPSYSVQIKSLDRLADDVLGIRLRILTPDSFRFKSGQFIGIRWIAKRLKYFSIANAPQTSAAYEIELHIRKKEDGEFTNWLFDTAKRGDILGLEGPFGDFEWISPCERPAILLATGTGFAPIKSLIETHRLWERTTPVYFYWGGRTLPDIYMSQLAAQWGKLGASFHYAEVLSKACSENWPGRRGRLPKAVLEDHPDLSGFDVYACGSPEMIDSARSSFIEKGSLSAEHFFADAFNVGPPPGKLPAVSFEIAFSESSVQGRIQSETGITLLEAIINAGLKLDHYCGGGAVCATCRVNISKSKVSEPEEDEADLLDCLTDLRSGDRLACQVLVSDRFDNVCIQLPGRPSRVSRLRELHHDLSE
ncbi:2Fe-2S iron-sulfur cluster-binding protein [Pseudomonas sp. A-R-19]|uniref:2Fe-2S iron-sulfur cluster-binding protein n=1 Tax=Pseudomonas sp. A-R-19 TaxID=2832403 RepID=UPI001CBD06C9|nr:2Fe-2S iron-sulfur cluster-binding protein [Pseudomonas sp. A-R-19]